MTDNTAFHVKQQQINLAEIIGKLAFVSEDDLSRATQRYEIASGQLASAITASEAQTDAIFTITCCKSGTKLRDISLEEYTLLKDIHGEDRAKLILELKNTTHCAAHWLQTDSKSLEQLSERDPHGYFIYAADRVLKAKQPMFRNFGRNEDTLADAEITYKWHRQKAQAFVAVQSQPIAKVMKANELMRRYLSIIDTSQANHLVEFSEVDICAIADFRLLNFINDLQENMRRVLDWCWKNGRIRPDLTIDDIIKLKNLFRGHSNFAGQRKIEGQPNYERIIDELLPFFDKPLMRRLHQPKYDNEQVKEMQTGKKPITTLQSGMRFNFAKKTA